MTYRLFTLYFSILVWAGIVWFFTPHPVTLSGWSLYGYLLIPIIGGLGIAWLYDENVQEDELRK